jgi:hypothetical protein
MVPVVTFKPERRLGREKDSSRTAGFVLSVRTSV